MQSQETKTVQSFEITDFKALNNSDEPGSFEALVSVFGNVDHGGDRVVKGAFARTLGDWAVKGRSIPVLWSHDAESVPVGVVTEAAEINAGLKVKARLLIEDNPQAKAIHAAMKAGALHEFSFGYAVKEWGEVEEHGQAVRELKDVDLFEVSPVFRGMNPATRLRAVKSLDDDTQVKLADLIAELEDRTQKLEALSEVSTNVALKAVADTFRGQLEGLKQDQKQGEQDDNPEPNSTDVDEEAKARIRALQTVKPTHLE